MLKIDQAQPERDHWSTQGLILRMSEEERARVRWLLVRPPQYDFWTYGSPQQRQQGQRFSSMLLVHGLMSPEPLSAAMAFLAWHMKLLPAAVVLHYFCGLHQEPGGSADNGENRPMKLVGPCGIMRSLVFQLLSSCFPDSPTQTTPAPTATMANCYRLNLSGGPNFNSEAFMRDYKSASSIQALCYVFTRLVERLPPQTTIYCFIDGISSYERDERWARELSHMMLIFRSLMGRLRGPYLKVLITSPTRSLFDCNWLGLYLTPDMPLGPCF